MVSAKRRGDALTAALDRNRLQNDGPTVDAMPIEAISDKWRAFGRPVIEVFRIEVEQIADAREAARTIKGLPTIAIAHANGIGIAASQGG
jgi:transketolase